MARAPFLTLDGIDGTGKSTQARMLVDWLNEQGYPTILCQDPGGTPLGHSLRQILLESKADISPRAEALLFMASRAELVQRIIRPALEANQAVISDRFVAANVAYQAYAGGLDPEELWQVGAFSTGGLMPDATFILDLTVEEAVQRRGRGADRMEARGLAYLDRVRQGFLEMARNRPNWSVVDARPDLSSLQQQLRERVLPYFDGRL